MKALNSPNSDHIVTIEDHVKSSEIRKNMNQSIISFDYKLSDKASKSKLLKAAKRTPIIIEENSTSSNLRFSAGAWYHSVLPSAKYFDDAAKGENTCKVDDYTVRVGGVKLGKESNGKHVNTQIILQHVILSHPRSN